MSGTINYKIRSNGEEFRNAFKVKSIVVINEANRIPRARIILLDGEVSTQDFQLSNTDFFKPGQLLEIDLGHDTQVNNVFKGIILKHAIKVGQSNRSFLEIECKHPAVKLTVNRKNRMFFDITDQQAIQEILDDAGLDHQVNGMDQFTHGQLVQYDSTNWDFLMSRIDVNGHLVLFDNEQIVVKSPTMEGEAAITCEYGLNVLGFEAMMDGEQQFSNVESKAWDPSGQEIISGEGSGSFHNELGNVQASELAQAINPEPFLLRHSGSISNRELESWATARANKMELAKIKGQVTLRGDHTIFPGMIINLSGFGDRFTGKAFITGVRHEMGNGNWTTNVQFGLPTAWFSEQYGFNALPSSGLLPAVGGIQIGVVSQLENDPENEFRIRVKIPIVDNEDDGVWARVLKSYAGTDYGTIFYPEIGDEVMIGFVNNDPRQPVVLGSLHSSAREPSIVPLDDNHEKGLISRSQVKIIFNEEQESLTISTPGGREVILNDQQEFIKISDTNGNSIELNNEGITINSIKDLTLNASKDIQIEGINITSKANGKFAAEGNSGAEMKTGSIAVVKGSLVQIN